MFYSFDFVISLWCIYIINVWEKTINCNLNKNCFELFKINKIKLQMHTNNILYNFVRHTVLWSCTTESLTSVSVTVCCHGNCEWLMTTFIIWPLLPKHNFFRTIMEMFLFWSKTSCQFLLKVLQEAGTVSTYHLIICKLFAKSLCVSLYIPHELSCGCPWWCYGCYSLGYPSDYHQLCANVL